MSDLIDRQATLNALMEAVKSVGVLDADDIKTVFDALPSVQHEKAQLFKEGTTSDLISRQAAIDALAEQMPTPYTPDGSHPADEQIFQVQEVYVDCITTLELLPTIQTEPRTGKWALGFDNRYMEKYYYCSRCGGRKYEEHEPLDYFCSNCGADMRGEKDG